MRAPIELLNPTTYRTQLGDDEVEIGDVRASTFKPHVKLTRWNRECSLQLGLPTAEEGTHELRAAEGKVRWAGSDVEVDIYDLEPDERFEHGAIEFDIALLKRPADNRVVLQIETEGLDFYWQGELSPEEKAGFGTPDGGSYRPDWAVGSYAVYHASKRHNRYKAGKAFHIPRPRIVDAAGRSTWGELEIDEQQGLLIVTIPKDFLDTAVYPVRHAAGATFGKTDVGASQSDGSTDRLLGSYAMAAAGTGASISVYTPEDSYDDGPIEMALYQQSDGAFVKATDVINSPTPDDWNTANFTSAPTLTAQNYWIFQWAEEYAMRYDDGGSGTTYTVTEDYPGDWPDPLPEGGDTYDRLYSIYCTYTPSGGGETYECSASDGLKAGDSPGSQCVFGVSITDGLKGGDASGGAAIFPKAVADGLSCGDSTAATLTLPLTASDGVSHSDSPSAQLSLAEFLSEEVKLSDSPIASVTIDTALSDGASVGDLATSLANLNLSVQDGVTLSDLASILGAVYDLSLSDGVSVGESPALTLVISLALSDGIVIGDTVVKNIYVRIPITPSLLKGGYSLGEIRKQHDLGVMRREYTLGDKPTQ